MDIYQFSARRISGTEQPLADYRGKVLLIVNTASKCGFTKQYLGLQKLYRKYKEQGLMVLGFPCNQFKEQEPGSDLEIVDFCTYHYGVTFPIFSKIEVNGEHAEPLYQYLALQQPFEGFDPEHPLGKKLDEILTADDPDYRTKPGIKWNFTKFVIDRSGNVAARFEPTAPMEQVEACIKSLL